MSKRVATTARPVSKKAPKTAAKPKAAKTFAPLPPVLPCVHEALIEDHSQDMLRSGEGCVVTLADNSLMLIYSKFVGGSDHDHTRVVKRFSSDGGITWTRPELCIKTPKNILNDMSLSTLGLQDGRIALVFLRKVSLQDCRPYICFSEDEGQSWSKPIQTIPDKKVAYYVVNNDRLVQLKSGRLLIPFANHGDISQSVSPTNGCVYSDDSGATWQMGAQQKIEPKNIARPKNINMDHKEVVEHVIKKKLVVCQEPGVVELSDGRVMLWCRTQGGYMYQAFSRDGGVTFSPYKAMRDFAMPCGPQSIKTIPRTNRLVMLYNDRGDMRLGDPQFHWRRTLDVAVSDDDGKSWKRIGLLEPPAIPSTCYYSICFHGSNAIFTYYQGVMATLANGIYRPRNLTSLKLRIVRQSVLKK